MRLCLVSRELAPFAGGGIGVYVTEMARAMVRAGHEVHILTEPHPDMARVAAAELPGVRVHAVEVSRGRAALDAYPTYPMRYSMAVLDALSAIHGTSPFDYVEFPDYHAEGYFTLQARRTVGALAGAVLAVRLHSPWGLCRRGDEDWVLDRDGALIEHMELGAISAADAIVSPGPRVVEEVLAECVASGFRPRGITRRLGLPLDADRLGRDAGPGEPEHSPSERPVVLYYGRLQHLKGVHILLKAAVTLLESGVEAEFKFIGGDTTTGPFGRSMLGFLKSRVPVRWTSHFSFEPPRARGELVAAVRGAAVCCFPSLWEAFSMACVEAMALGAPVIAGDAGGLGSIVQDGVNGLLCRPGDAADLETALRRLLGDAALRSRLADAAPARAKQVCDPESTVRGTVELIEACRQTSGGASVVPVVRPARAATPEVSVIIPFYNLGRYLPDTLESLRRQTFTDYETIIIDDGSTDPESLALLKRLDGQGLRVVHKPNGGLGSARNAGLREARGRWVLPLDADDLIAPDYLAKTVAVAQADPGVAVVSALVSCFVEEASRPVGGWVPLGLDRDILPAFNVGAAAGSLLDRRAALDVGGYDERLTSYEDWDFWCRLAERDHRAAAAGALLAQPSRRSHQRPEARTQPLP